MRMQLCHVCGSLSVVRGMQIRWKTTQGSATYEFDADRSPSLVNSWESVKGRFSKPITISETARAAAYPLEITLRRGHSPGQTFNFYVHVLDKADGDMMGEVIGIVGIHLVFCEDPASNDPECGNL